MINNNLVLGKGELHFNLFAPGTKAGSGERYLGNTPGFTLTVNESAIDRKILRRGMKVVADRYVTERSYSGQIVCDQMSKENVALWLGSTSVSTNVAASGGSTISETIIVMQGLGYQLGTGLHPLGHHKLTNIVFKIGATVIDQSSNFVIDSTKGRFTVKESAPNVPNGTSLIIEYKTSGYVRSVTDVSRELKGSVRYIADNVYGRNTDYFFPFVTIEPSGSFDLKTADWQRMQLKMSVMQMFGRELFYAGNLE